MVLCTLWSIHFGQNFLLHEFLPLKKWTNLTLNLSSAFSDKPNPGDVRYEKLRFKYSDRNNDNLINPDEFGRFAMPDLFLDMAEMQVDQYIASKSSFYSILITFNL